MMMGRTELVEQVLHFIHNYFEKERRYGTYTIAEGTLVLPFVKTGQYFRIIGSDLNDGVYEYPAQLTNEVFTGSVAPLSIPRNLLSVIAEIDDWQVKNGEAVDSPYQSESFGGYSYTKASVSGSNRKGGDLYGWQEKFATRLNQWRKIG